MDVTEETIENDFSVHLSVVLDFFWHCRINTICVHCRKKYNLFALAQNRQKNLAELLALLPVSKSHTHKFIFSNNVYTCILYFYSASNNTYFIRDLI